MKISSLYTIIFFLALMGSIKAEDDSVKNKIDSIMRTRWLPIERVKNRELICELLKGHPDLIRKYRNLLDCSTIYCLEFGVSPRLFRVYESELTMIFYGFGSLDATPSKGKNKRSRFEQIMTADGKLFISAIRALKKSESPSKTAEKLLELLSRIKDTAFLSKPCDMKRVALRVSIALLSLGAEQKMQKTILDLSQKEIPPLSLLYALSALSPKIQSRFLISLLKRVLAKRGQLPDSLRLGLATDILVDSLAINGSPDGYEFLSSLFKKRKTPDILRAMSYCLPDGKKSDFSKTLASLLLSDKLPYGLKSEALCAIAYHNLTPLSDKVKDVVLDRKQDKSFRLKALQVLTLLDREVAKDTVQQLEKEPFFRTSKVFWQVIGKCWADDLASKILLIVKSKDFKDSTAVIWLPYCVPIMGTDTLLLQLMASLLNEYDDVELRRRLLLVIANLSSKYSLRVLIEALYDPALTIRVCAFLLAFRPGQKWSAQLGKRCNTLFLSKDSISCLRDSAIMLYNKNCPYLYYVGTTRAETGSLFMVDTKAKMSGTPIDPYTRLPLTEEELKRLREEEAKFEELLKQLRKKQEEAWKRKLESGR